MQIYNRFLYTQKYECNFFEFFLQFIKMESTSQNNNINAIKKVRELFNEIRSNLSRE